MDGMNIPLVRSINMNVEHNEQMIIISACCYADDHCADPYEYAKKALEKEGITYNSSHEMFVDWYLNTEE